MYVRFPAEKSVTRQLFTDAVLKPDAFDHWRCSGSDLIEKTGADPEMCVSSPHWLQSQWAWMPRIQSDFEW